MSLSKNQLKLITSLQQKKYRQKHKLFLAEGVKVVDELLKSDVEAAHLFFVEEYTPKVASLVAMTQIDKATLKKISTLKTPNKVLGLFKIPTALPPKNEGLILALDGVNDPGNLGTIIRLCDWFGISQIICSKNTVDCYNQKVVQSTMGSLTRVQINYVDLTDYLKAAKLPVFTADMDGDNIYTTELVSEGILVMGNEANGISEEINQLVKHKLTIPRFGTLQETESLNVATATAILLSEFKRSLHFS